MCRSVIKMYEQRIWKIQQIKIDELSLASTAHTHTHLVESCDYCDNFNLFAAARRAEEKRSSRVICKTTYKTTQCLSSSKRAFDTRDAHTHQRLQITIFVVCEVFDKGIPHARASIRDASVCIQFHFVLDGAAGGAFTFPLNAQFGSAAREGMLCVCLVFCGGIK